MTAGLLGGCREFLAARVGVAVSEFLCDRRPAGEDIFAAMGCVSDDTGASEGNYFFGGQ